MREIKKALVLGSGVMGATIAAHLANVGIKSYLLDLLPQGVDSSIQDKKIRNKIASDALANLVKLKPAAAFTRERLQLITPGNFEDHLHLVGEVDWVIEVVIENLDIKKELLSKVYSYWKPGTYVSTNTSGVSVNAMVDHLPQEFQEYFLGTHFFNPPRYMRLLEIIPGSKTLPEVINYFKTFGEELLGKGVVSAKDTPNFIANRIGVYGLLSTIKIMEKYGFSVAEVDALTGTAIGRPKSASFRTLDMVGLDTFLHVAKNVYDNVDDPEEKASFASPEFLREMVAKGWFGDKTKQGFYKKSKDAVGNKVIEALNYQTLEYAGAEKIKFPVLEKVKSTPELKNKLRLIVKGENPENNLVWEVLKGVMLYSANLLQAIADDLVAVDNAMKWGFNWELGPFETWDALGFKEVAARMQKDGETLPSWVTAMLDKGYEAFYQDAGQVLKYYDPKIQEYVSIVKSQLINLPALKKDNKLIRGNAGASLIDLGDGVACLELHSPNNSIGQDIMDLIYLSVDEVERNYQGLVIGNQGRNFCVGANLMLVLLEAQKGNWQEIDLIIRHFQGSLMALKYCSRPVVAAPFGMTLGGGYEICAHTAQVQTSAETYMGLVEVGVGLLPGGGGCKELLYRNLEGVALDGSVDLLPFVRRAFETIALAKVSTSGLEAKDLGYLRSSDGISINSDLQLAQAKGRVLGLAKAGYRPPVAKAVPVLGESGIATFKLMTYTMEQGSYISSHDRHIANKVAEVLCGGYVPAGTLVTEEYLLNLEKEAFVSLAKEPKSQDRMLHMLTKGKPLRN